MIGPAFKGIGAALVLLGLLAAAGLAYAYKRAEDAGGVLATSCADGDLSWSASRQAPTTSQTSEEPTHEVQSVRTVIVGPRPADASDGRSAR